MILQDTENDVKAHTNQVYDVLKLGKMVASELKICKLCLFFVTRIGIITYKITVDTVVLNIAVGFLNNSVLIISGSLFLLVLKIWSLSVLTLWPSTSDFSTIGFC